MHLLIYQTLRVFTFVRTIALVSQQQHTSGCVKIRKYRNRLIRKVAGTDSTATLALMNEEMYKPAPRKKGRRTVRRCDELKPPRSGSWLALREILLQN